MPPAHGEEQEGQRQAGSTGLHPSRGRGAKRPALSEAPNAVGMQPASSIQARRTASQPRWEVPSQLGGALGCGIPMWAMHAGLGTAERAGVWAWHPVLQSGQLLAGLSISHNTAHRRIAGSLLALKLGDLFLPLVAQEAASENDGIRQGSLRLQSPRGTSFQAQNGAEAHAQTCFQKELGAWWGLGSTLQFQMVSLRQGRLGTGACGH